MNILSEAPGVARPRGADPGHRAPAFRPRGAGAWRSARRSPAAPGACAPRASVPSCQPDCSPWPRTARCTSQRHKPCLRRVSKAARLRGEVHMRRGVTGEPVRFNNQSGGKEDPGSGDGASIRRIRLQLPHIISQQPRNGATPRAVGKHSDTDSPLETFKCDEPLVIFPRPQHSMHRAVRASDTARTSIQCAPDGKQCRAGCGGQVQVLVCCRKAVESPPSPRGANGRQPRARGSA